MPYCEFCYKKITSDERSIKDSRQYYHIDCNMRHYREDYNYVTDEEISLFRLKADQQKADQLASDFYTGKRQYIKVI